MSIYNVKVGTCDCCGKSIDLAGTYVDAGVYGRAYHVECWDTIGGTRLCRELGLDDIDLMRGEVRVGRVTSAR